MSIAANSGLIITFTVLMTGCLEEKPGTCIRGHVCLQQKVPSLYQQCVCGYYMTVRETCEHLLCTYSATDLEALTEQGMAKVLGVQVTVVTHAQPTHLGLQQQHFRKLRTVTRKLTLVGGVSLKDSLAWWYSPPSSAHRSSGQARLRVYR